MKKRVSVVGAVIVRDGLVLAAKRGAAMSIGGLWEFPGGKVEGSETPEAALERELREELRCGVRVGAHVETTVHEYDAVIVELATYRCELIAGEPVLTEHDEVRWLRPDELMSVDWAPADIPAVERLMRAGV